MLIHAPIDCSRLRVRRVLKIKKVLTWKWEETGERKGCANEYCPLFTQQDSHSISFVLLSLALFMCFPGLFPYITWRTALQTKRRWAPPSSTLTTGSRTVAPEIKHWKHELVLLRWRDVGQLPFCLLGRGNDSQESSSKNPESH